VISFPVLCVAVLIEERTSVEKNLRKSQEQLKENYEEVRSLAGKLITAQDDERRRIALELHDDVVQRLGLLSIQLQSLEKSVPPEMTEAHDVLSSIRQDAEAASTALRELSHQLHSSVLQHVGLPTALKGLCRTVSQEHRIAAEVEANEIHGSTDEIDLGLFRIAQEALNNVVKHSNAADVKVRLVQDANQLHLEVNDNGIGFNPSGQSIGLGMISMRERVRLLNGELLIESKPNMGTRIQVWVPLSRGGTQRVAAAEGL